MKVLFSSFILVFGLVQAQPLVVTSLFPYRSLVEQITGEHATVINLLSAGTSEHTFDPSPRDVAQVARADLIVLNGGLDEWLHELVEASGSSAPILEALSLVTFEPIGAQDEHAREEAHAEEGRDDEGSHEDDGEHEEAHDHSGENPHIWLEPTLMMQLLPRLAEALAEVDPERAETYRRNAGALLEELEALDAELLAQLEPVRGAAFVPFHDAWPYFARRYDLELVVEIEPAPGREPSARYIAEALELIEASGARAIFSERQLPPRPAEVVAETAGLPLFVLDPVGGSEDTSSYQALLRYNARVILEALSP